MTSLDPEDQGPTFLANRQPATVNPETPSGQNYKHSHTLRDHPEPSMGNGLRRPA